MREEFKRALRAPQVWASFIVSMITLMGYSLAAWVGSAEELMEYRESALHLSLGGIFFGGFMLLLPFCAAIAHSTSQVDDIRSGIMRWGALRSSVRRYACYKVSTCMIVAALASAGAFALHAVIWNMVALPNDPFTYPNHIIYFSEQCFFYNWYVVCHGLPVYIEVTIGIAFTASIWAVVALAVAVWVPDKLLVVIIPSFLYYLWNADATYWLFGIHSLHPAALFNDGLDAERMVTSIIAYLVVLVISLIGYYAGCRRRCRYV